jgi:hypothetical protein
VMVRGIERRRIVDDEEDGKEYVFIRAKWEKSEPIIKWRLEPPPALTWLPVNWGQRRREMGKSEPAAHFDFVNGCAGFFVLKSGVLIRVRHPVIWIILAFLVLPVLTNETSILFLDCFSYVPFYSPPVLSTVASRLKHMQRINISKTLTIA